MKILVIEDDSGLNRGLAFALSQKGYEAVTAASAGEERHPYWYSFDGYLYRIMITDEGMGISEKEYPKIFQCFY
ncbi:MAG: hypothetical protein ACLTBP_08935 [Frisingicoccus sp.]